MSGGQQRDRAAGQERPTSSSRICSTRSSFRARDSVCGSFSSADVISASFTCSMAPRRSQQCWPMSASWQWCNTRTGCALDDSKAIGTFRKLRSAHYAVAMRR